MSKVQDYRQKLRKLLPYADPEGQYQWDAYLLRESGLPGPRGNLELAQAVVAEGDKALFMHYLAYDARRAPANTPYEFLAFCGITGMGKLLADGERGVLSLLRGFASDPRWRAREAVAIALQAWGDQDMDALIQEMVRWGRGSRLEQRAVVAALCEPRLLTQPGQVVSVLNILDDVTASLAGAADRRDEDFRSLRKTLGYGWSVAVAASPAEGKRRMERWLSSKDSDVRWVMRENLKKDRLLRVDREWVESAASRVT